MPFEQRMREGLHRASTSVDPAVERSLHRVMSRRARRRVRRRISPSPRPGLWRSCSCSVSRRSNRWCPTMASTMPPGAVRLPAFTRRRFENPTYPKRTRRWLAGGGCGCGPTVAWSWHRP